MPPGAYIRASLPAGRSGMAFFTRPPLVIFLFQCSYGIRRHEVHQSACLPGTERGRGRERERQRERDTARIATVQIGASWDRYLQEFYYRVSSSSSSRRIRGADARFCKFSRSTANSRFPDNSSGKTGCRFTFGTLRRKISSRRVASRLSQKSRADRVPRSEDTRRHKVRRYLKRHCTWRTCDRRNRELDARYRETLARWSTKIPSPNWNACNYVAFQGLGRTYLRIFVVNATCVDAADRFGKLKISTKINRICFLSWNREECYLNFRLLEWIYLYAR